MTSAQRWLALAIIVSIACVLATVVGGWAWQEERWLLAVLDAFCAGVDLTLAGVGVAGALFTARRRWP